MKEGKVTKEGRKTSHFFGLVKGIDIGVHKQSLSEISQFIADAIEFGFERYPEHFPTFTNKTNVDQRLRCSDIEDEYGGFYIFKPLLRAAFYGRKNLIEFFIDMGADVNAPGGASPYIEEGVGEFNNRGHSALCYAAANGHQDCVALLIARVSGIICLTVQKKFKLSVRLTQVLRVFD